MASLAYANAGSGPSAGGIGWVNFGSSFSLTPGQTVNNLSATLLDGSTITFDVSSVRNSGDIKTTFARVAPYSGLSVFGIAPPAGGYTGLITSYVSLMLEAGTFDYTLTFSNISVVDANSNPVNNYTIVLADPETTSGPPYNEQSIYTTDGGVWQLLTTLGDPNNPQRYGLGTQTFTAKDATTVLTGSNVVTTQSPTNISVQLIANAGGYQGIVFGVALTKVSIDKNIINRLNSADQFNLSITGPINDTATTTGTNVGTQLVSANVFGEAGDTYTINESMSGGSANPLSNYVNCVSWSNLASGGTVGPNPGALGDSVTLQLGDVMTATITNTPKNIVYSVDRTSACNGDTVMFSITIPNPGNQTYSNILFESYIPSGTSLVANSFKQDSTAIVGSLGSVLTLPNPIAAGTSSVVSFSVKIDTATPSPNPITNQAIVTFPNGCPVTSNSVSVTVGGAACRGVPFI